MKKFCSSRGSRETTHRRRFAIEQSHFSFDPIRAFIQLRLKSNDLLSLHPLECLTQIKSASTSLDRIIQISQSFMEREQDFQM